MADADRDRDVGSGRRRGWTPAVPILVGLALQLGCGGGETASSSPPIPHDCLQSWNSERASLEFGKHVYGEHRSKRAQVALVEPARGSFNVGGDETCAVVFAVEESDPEYGDVGLVVTKFGWASLRELARGDAGRLNALQREATEAPNANLFPDGTLDSL
jgi:hypothetical protein